MKCKFLSALVFVLVLCSVAGAASLPSVTMLSTKTCPACQQMTKVLEQINREYKGKVDTNHIYLEDNPDVAEKYKVRYVPMLIFSDSSGNEVSRVVGYRSFDDVIKIFSEAGVKM